MTLPKRCSRGVSLRAMMQRPENDEDDDYHLQIKSNQNLFWRHKKKYLYRYTRYKN